MTSKKKRNVWYIICAVMVFFIFDRAAVLYIDKSGDMLEKGSAAAEVFADIMRQPFSFSFQSNALLAGAFGASCIGVAYAYFVMGAHKLMPGKEHGSAEWSA